MTTPINEDIDTSVIYSSLSINSTTLYTYDNTTFTSKLNINYSELISKNLGVINSIQDSRMNDYKISNNLILNNSLPANATAAVGTSNTPSPASTQNEYVSLVLYYNKKLMKNNDLITIIILCNDRILKNFVYNLLDKLMVTYLSDYYDEEDANNSRSYSNGSNDNFEFKIKLKEIINDEEAKLKKLTADYGSTVTDEIDEVRELMNENIDKILSRGENLNSLITKTSNLNSSANSFRRRTVMIKRKFWWSNVRFVVLIASIIGLLIYLFIGLECGLPFYGKCLHPSKPKQPSHPQYPKYPEEPEEALLPDSQDEIEVKQNFEIYVADTHFNGVDASTGLL
ncbi:hypothetical protein CANARDRAFT_5404 [[Candida] arabinofermentans NRRL YB-2248]|uniref:V-SNARE coiled-coil homology domain-containing protein n=1 Tax=[Candida] arabinofermentans NRRL YB-2248 TaxID=983967 RepID=A0A1E4T8P0_9ASCO|nr:hypothetical protein CANARDRAFT_5404 [[Candida] arabinofermentans NRRL YB-2248]